MQTVPNVTDGSVAGTSGLANTVSQINANFVTLEEQIAAWKNKSALWTSGLPSVGVTAGMVVAFDGSTLIPAHRAITTGKNSLVPGYAAFPLGIVDSVGTDNVASVYLAGIISKTGIRDILCTEAPEAGEEVNVPLYLDSAGKLTRNPSGLLVYVGTALDSDTFLLNPSPDCLNSLYNAYRFEVPGLPATLPTYTANTDTWALADVTSAKIGWVPAANSGFASAADGASWYFRLPEYSSADWDSLTFLSEDEIVELKSMSKAIGPYRPDMQAVLTRNGVALQQKTETHEGRWRLDEYGLWWYGVGLHEVPWDSNLHRCLKLSASSAANDTLTMARYDDAHFGAVVAFAHADTLNLVVGATPADENGVLPLVGAIPTNVFTVASAVSTAADGHALAITTHEDIATAHTDNVYFKWAPAYWQIAKGRDETRPKLQVQFTRVNPDLKDIVVSSLSYDATIPTTDVPVEIVGTTTGATHGDLKIRTKVPLTSVAGTSASATAVASLTWENNKLKVQTTPVVTSLLSSGGISIQAAENGAYILGMTGGTLNTISQLEPENTKLEFKGLNSYLVFGAAACGVVGKFSLPASIPANTSVRINVFGFKKGVGTAPVFSFSYNQISYLTGTISTDVTPGDVDVAADITTSTCQRLFTEASLVISNPVANGVVNFRLSKAVEASNPMLLCAVLFNWEFISS